MPNRETLTGEPVDLFVMAYWDFQRLIIDSGLDELEYTRETGEKRRFAVEDFFEGGRMVMLEFGNQQGESILAISRSRNASGKAMWSINIAFGLTMPYGGKEQELLVADLGGRTWGVELGAVQGDRFKAKKFVYNESLGDWQGRKTPTDSDLNNITGLLELVKSLPENSVLLSVGIERFSEGILWFASRND